MSLIKWRNSNCSPLAQVFNEDAFFNLENYNQWFAALDIKEDKERYVIHVDLPGLNKENINISFDNGLLTIEGERKSEAQSKENEYHRIERSYGRFVRTLNLGTSINADKIDAHYKDGVLSVTIPKSEQAKPKLIDIKSE